MKLAERLRTYANIASPLAAYPLLVIFWAEAFYAFSLNMLPRLALLPNAGLRAPDRDCIAPDCDFSVFWPAGVLARLGRVGEIYDPALFLAVRQHIFVPGVPPLNWFYPPPALLTVVPISYLPFGAGFFVWIAALGVASIILLRAASLSWPVILAAMLSPAVLCDYQLGQFGALFGAALICGLMLAGRAPWGAGVALGLLAMKPQYGILAPAALLGARRWRAILAAAAVAAVLAAAATALFGWPVWHDYIQQGLAASKGVMADPGRYMGEKTGVSVFWMMRSFGAGLGTAYAIQTAVTLAALAGSWAIWREPAARPLLERMALTVFLSTLASPFGYTDDLAACSVAVAALAEARAWRIGVLDALFWVWPALCPVMFEKTGLLVTPLFVAALVVRGLVRGT